MIGLPDKPFLTTTEAGRLFGISRQMVIALIAAGKVKGWHTEGGHWRVSAASLRQYVESQMAGEREEKEPVYTMDDG